MPPDRSNAPPAAPGEAIEDAFAGELKHHKDNSAAAHAEAGTTLKFGDDRAGAQACLPPQTVSPDFQFQRPDWVLFRSVSGLSQKAGVPAERLRRLVLKELVDNALDAGGRVKVRQEGSDTFAVTDDGPGLVGSAEDIARLFSISRPLVSSKLWRLPTRGALGNGPRVVAGAVAASGGKLVVTTQNKQMLLTPRASDGATDVAVVPVQHARGTTVAITFGKEIPTDPNPLSWAHSALMFGHYGSFYRGRPSAWWSDGDHWFEMLQASGSRPVRDFIANLDGCTGAKAGKIVAELNKGTACRDLSRDQATRLFLTARGFSNPVRPERLALLWQILRWGSIFGIPAAWFA